MNRNRSLPIEELREEIVASLQTSNRLIIEAPTGSGKSTQVPQFLLESGLLENGRAVILQPRRLAARMLAARVAQERNSSLGQKVGYCIRHDIQYSAETQLLFVTEGILLRQMLEDPSLSNISTLIFDEFHERHLYSDISLMQALRLQESERPDLKIIVMSATLDTSALADYLEPCTVLRSTGRTHPVEITYLAREPAEEKLWDLAASAASNMLSTTPGHLLIFMPGAYEIGRTISALRTELPSDIAIFPLHGELPPADQDAAVKPSTIRKVIVTTNVAETSLTIDGVTGVIDAGMARVARFDARRGMNTLLVEKISCSSADQRAGRAGRTAPGHCLRLWTERDHARRALRDVPEIHRVDLAEVLLLLKKLELSPTANWLEAPHTASFEKAEMLLHDLGALDHEGKNRHLSKLADARKMPGASGAQNRSVQNVLEDSSIGATQQFPAAVEFSKMSITERGHRMLAFPTHPRYAAMLLAAEKLGCVRAAALMAALTQARPLLLRTDRNTEETRRDLFGGGSSDFLVLSRVFSWAQRNDFKTDACRKLAIHADAARQVARIFEQFLNLARAQGLTIDAPPAPDEAIAECILAGFADQVARRRSAGTHLCDMVHARRGLLVKESAATESRLLVATEIHEIGQSSGDVRIQLSMATAIDEGMLRKIFPDDFSDRRELCFDIMTHRVVEKKEKVFRDLTLESITRDITSSPEASTVLAQGIMEAELPLPTWNEESPAWIHRWQWLHRFHPELELPEWTEELHSMAFQQCCQGALSYREVKDRPAVPALETLLSPAQRAAFARLASTHYALPSGRKAPLRYQPNGDVILSATIQDLFGLASAPKLASGRVIVTVEILAPNRRPIQITRDLVSFWKEAYPKIKMELSRRYPKHEWK